MKLSEAIRLGAMLHPQAFDAFRTPEGHTCVMAAAADAAGLVTTPGRSPMPALRETFPILNTIITGDHRFQVDCQYAADFDLEGELTQILVFMNDCLHWSRERIADWIEQEVESRFPSRRPIDTFPHGWFGRTASGVNIASQRLRK